MTKAQHEWLSHLSQNGPTARGRSNTAYHCMMKGWTEWFVQFADGRIERLEGQDTSQANTWLDAITPAGRSALTQGLNGPLLEDGPECLQMIDGRSMNTGRKHIASTSAAETALQAAQAEIARMRVEIEAARLFGGGFFGDAPTEATREVYRDQARTALTPQEPT